MRINLRTMFQSLSAATAFVVVPAAETQAPSTSRLDWQRIDAFVAPYLAARDFMGVIGVHRTGQSPDVRAYGLAHVERGTPHSEDDVFNIGSISKQFTATAVLLLEEDGLLRVTDTVARHLPDFPHGRLITIHQLLTHTSGVADVFEIPRSRFADCPEAFACLLAAIGREPLRTPPGSQYAYSNGGYAVLAALVDRVAGRAYERILAERIFTRLGMSRTFADGPSATRPGRILGYDAWGARELTPSSLGDAAIYRGAGSIWSTARDLLVWSDALHTGRVLSGTSYAKLTTNYGNNYGYGVSIYRRFGHAAVGHDGRVAGFAGDLTRFTRDSVSVIVLSNVQSVARDEIRHLIAGVALNERVEPPASRPAPRAARPSTELAGEYVFGPRLLVTARVDGERLLIRANAGAETELVSVGEDRWFSRTLYQSVTFQRDTPSAPFRLIWGDGPGAPVGIRR